MCVIDFIVKFSFNCFKPKKSEDILNSKKDKVNDLNTSTDLSNSGHHIITINPEYHVPTKKIN